MNVFIKFTYLATELSQLVFIFGQNEFKHSNTKEKNREM